MNSFRVAAWQHFMLERIRASDYATLALVVLNDAPAVTRSFLSRFWTERRYMLYKAYTRAEDILVRPRPDAFAIRDATGLVAGVPVLRVTPRQEEYVDVIEDADLETIRSHAIDVFIRLGFRILKGGILHAARFGVWSYHHGDNRVNRGGPPGFWEVFEAWPVTGSILQILTQDLEDGLVLCRSYSATDIVSVNRNRHGYYWKTASFIPRKLRKLHDEGEERFLDDVASTNERPSVYSNRLYRRPTNGTFLMLLARHALRYAKWKLLKTLFVGQWILMFDLGEGIARSLYRFKKIVPPRDRFWADPHVVYRDHRYYVFIEEYPYRTRKGHIAVFTIDERGNHERPVTVLERPYHLSYPFIFEWNGDYYMIPETASNNTIEVYKCTDFPERWEHHKVLMENVRAVDATLFHDRDTWWLFTTLQEHEGASIRDELFLFHADNPLSAKWTPHASNPVVSDIRSARPAGRLFRYKGSVYRPSQYLYGAGIKLNRITSLTDTKYAEEEVCFLAATWDDSVTAMHTFSHEHRLTVIDARLRRLKTISVVGPSRLSEQPKAPSENK